MRPFPFMVALLFCLLAMEKDFCSNILLVNNCSPVMKIVPMLRTFLIPVYRSLQGCTADVPQVSLLFPSLEFTYTSLYNPINRNIEKSRRWSKMMAMILLWVENVSKSK